MYVSTFKISPVLFVFVVMLLALGCERTVFLGDSFKGNLDEISCGETADLFVHYLFNYSPENAKFQFERAIGLSSEEARNFALKHSRKLGTISETGTQCIFLGSSRSTFLGRDGQGQLLFELRGTMSKFIGTVPLPRADTHFKMTCRFLGSSNERGHRAQIVEFDILENR